MIDVVLLQGREAALAQTATTSPTASVNAQLAAVRQVSAALSTSLAHSPAFVAVTDLARAARHPVAAFRAVVKDAEQSPGATSTIKVGVALAGTAMVAGPMVGSVALGAAAAALCVLLSGIGLNASSSDRP